MGWPLASSGFSILMSLPSRRRKVPFAEGDGARDDELALEARVWSAIAATATSSTLPSIDERGIGQLGAALPLLDDARVARLGQRARPEVGADEEGVAVAPGDVALRLGQREAVLDELLGLQVELADDRGIGAAARERRSGSGRSSGSQKVAPCQTQFSFSARAQRIQVEHDLPVRLGLAVLVERRAPPQAALVLRVAPEVVVEFAGLLTEGDPLVRIQDPENRSSSA